LSELAPHLLLWIGFAVMTGAVVWALLRPLAKRSEGKGDAQDLALYRDQLAEVSRDLERGVIAPLEAEAAKIEVSRRLLAAADAVEREKATPGGRRSPRAIALLVMLAVPVLSLGLYLSLGSPDMPDVPFAPRVTGPADQLPLDALVLKVEQHLKDNPADLRGWEVLGPAYIRQGNFTAAITAWSRAIILGGETGSRFAARGEAEVLSANGVVTPSAREDFVKAVKLNAHEPRAQFYLGIADVQDGKKDAAARRWKALLAAAPKNAPWRASVEAELRSLTNPASGPTAEQAGAAADMTPEARQQMIEGMVSGLATRLDKNPNDLAGWLRLIRAYGVLGKHGEAEAALSRARTTFATDKSALAELDAAEKSLPAQ
jgi:cytochrome c-type biogenesis protein CcmH